jgi:hypothetical protein
MCHEEEVVVVEEEEEEDDTGTHACIKTWRNSCIYMHLYAIWCM